MYTAVLTVHSWLRWLALLLGMAATLNASRDRLAPSERPPGARWDTFFMLAVDLQVLCGLFLYFGLSPFTKAAMEDFGAAWSNPALRFWGVVHVGLMIAVVMLVRIGRVMAVTAKTPTVRRSWRFACFAAATLVMILGIPWPGLSNGRPLFRVG